MTSGQDLTSFRRLQSNTLQQPTKVPQSGNKSYVLHRPLFCSLVYHVHYLFGNARKCPSGTFFNNALSSPLIGECYQSLGCWKDDPNRAIPTLEGTDPRLDNAYGARHNPVEKCYQVAHSRGFTVFAVQDGGQCFGSADGHNTFFKYGRSSDCGVDGKGGPKANEVYLIGM